MASQLNLFGEDSMQARTCRWNGCKSLPRLLPERSVNRRAVSFEAGLDLGKFLLERGDWGLKASGQNY
jgi:hypothetical protein